MASEFVMDFLIRQGRVWALSCAVSAAALCGLVFAPPPAMAQEDGNTVVSLQSLPEVDDDEQMLVEADELIYDNVNETVVAQGAVQIYYGPYTLQADRVVYDQPSRRIRAEGNVRVTEPDGNVIYANAADLSDDFRDGFLQSLSVETIEETRITAAAAERSGDNTTVFNRGVYTACKPCEEDPSKPPLWQVKAVRVVHDQQQRMIYYENASLEFFGLPVAYFPFFANPDPTVRRKTGFLTPGIRTTDMLGVGVEIPFFVNIAPNRDVTLRPVISTRQGLLMQAEWRHRLANGTYSVRGAGIKQLQPADVPDFPGDDEEFRGFVATQGRFAINKYWSYGWDATLVSDDGFLKSYGINGNTWLTSSADLTGQSERSFLQTNVYRFQRLNTFDYDQSELPIVTPDVDYNKVWNRNILGGELAFDASFYNTHRGDIDDRALLTEISAGRLAETDYAYGSRFVGELQWRRQIIDPVGQVFTPFAALRGDLFHNEQGYNAARESFTAPSFPASYDQWQPTVLESESTARVIPTVGLEYRYPFASRQDWGTQTIEPIAQVFYRTDTHGDQDDLLNEDAISIVFDSTSLFDRDKFSGYDRVETGLRANVGLRYSAQFNNGGSASFLFGRSFHLAGDNPFPNDSGLEDDGSDYVGSASVEFGSHFAVTALMRLDGESFSINRNEIVGSTQVGRVYAGATYAHILEQPGIGAVDDRQQFTANGGLRLTDNWSVSGHGRFDIQEDRLNQTGFGLHYGDECFTFGLSYSETYDANEDINRTFGLTFNLRTIGGFSTSSTELSVFQEEEQN